MHKKITKTGFLICGAALFLLAGLILYIITSTTGFLASSAVNPLPIICSLAALAFLAALVFGAERMSPVVTDLSVVAATLLMIGSFVNFTLSRVNLAADVYFIPVNYPRSEETALHCSIAGVVLYLIAIITLIVVSFSHESAKKA